MHCCKQHIYFWIAYIFLFEYILLIQIINVKYNKIQQRYNMLIGKYIFETTIWISVCFQNIFSYDIYYKRFWDNFPQGKLPANPKLILTLTGRQFSSGEIVRIPLQTWEKYLKEHWHSLSEYIYINQYTRCLINRSLFPIVI